MARRRTCGRAMFGCQTDSFTRSSVVHPALASPTHSSEDVLFDKVSFSTSLTKIKETVPEFQKALITTTSDVQQMGGYCDWLQPSRHQRYSCSLLQHFLQIRLIQLLTILKLLCILLTDTGKFYIWNSSTVSHVFPWNRSAKFGTKKKSIEGYVNRVQWILCTYTILQSANEIPLIYRRTESYITLLNTRRLATCATSECDFEKNK